MGISMNYDNEFWALLNKLVSENEIIIDRPKGTRHPKYNITYEMIIENKHIEKGSKEIWDFVLKILDNAVEKGYLKK
jgi:inorganic pyrophosphatase